MKDSISAIPHLDEIKKIRELEQRVYKESNVPVCDISHWNSGVEYKQLILSYYKSHNLINFSDYHYSYEYHDNVKRKIMSHLLHNSAEDYSCVLIQNATAAICCIADYLKKHKYKKICILEPAYFSISSCLLSFGLNICKEPVILNDKGEVELPYDNIFKNKYDVIWITSPIFSTGTYFTQKQIECINSLMQNNILLIIDESAASPDCFLTNRLLVSENLIAIFSPHKYLAINSSKFAAIICSSSVSSYIEDWIDVFVGSLPVSTCIAVEHYLSSNYKTCIDVHDKYIENNINIINELCIQFPTNHFKGDKTNYITLCNTTLPYIESLEKLDMLKIMKYAHVSFIPGYINGFSEQWGFCYRVNLTQDTTTLKNSLGRLFSYFS